MAKIVNLSDLLVGQVFVFSGQKKSVVKLPVSGKIIHKMDLSVHRFEAIVAHAVGNGQKLRLQCKVIAADLCESGVVDSNEGGFTFYQKKWK